MNSYWIAVGAVVPFVVQVGLFLRWLHRRLRDDELTRAFISDLALNHLPHIYHALRRIAEHQGIEIAEPPVIRYVNLKNPR